MHPNASTRERWLPVVGWEGMYEVSDQGQVWSLGRDYISAKGNRIIKHPRMMKPHVVDRWGHEHVQLRDNDRSRFAGVYRLMLEAFVGPCPPGMVTLHINGDATDNRLENVRWGTQLENMQDRLRHGTNPNASKTHCKRGHEFDEGNTIWHLDRRSGKRNRTCRTCRNALRRKASDPNP